jgi:outer membrane protein assembly factor BamB
MIWPWNHCGAKGCCSPAGPSEDSTAEGELPKAFRFWCLLLAFGLSTAGSADSRANEDWPQFLGPRANGTSLETGLLDRWPTNGPPLLWEKQIGTGYSAPSVRGHRLVLHHRIGNEEIVEGLEAATGKPLWRYGYPSRYEDPYGYNNGPRCTPLLTVERCYTFGAEGKLLCLELETGRLVWQRDTAKDWEVPPAFFGVGSTPILEGDLLIVMVGGQPNSGVVAFDAKTGSTAWESVGQQNWQGQPMLGWPRERTVVWKRWDKQASYATPVAATVNGQRQLFCLMRQGLVSLDPTNGAVQFSRWFRAQQEESVNAANPVVVDDLVFISTAYHKVGSLLLKVNPDNRGYKEVWRSTVLEIHWTTPIHHNGYLYAFSGRNEPDARFRCVELKTGKLMWDRDESWPPHSERQPKVYGRGSAIMADGKLIVLGEGGLLGLFKANPNKPEELARWQVPDLHYPCWAAPVLSRGKLYLRSEDRLICLALSDDRSTSSRGE